MTETVTVIVVGLVLCGVFGLFGHSANSSTKARQKHDSDLRDILDLMQKIAREVDQLMDSDEINMEMRREVSALRAEIATLRRSVLPGHSGTSLTPSAGPQTLVSPGNRSSRRALDLD